VLDSSGSAVEAPLPTYLRDGAFAVAWRRSTPPNHRLKLVTVDRDRRRGGTLNATTTGESAYDPQWAAGPAPALLWSRRTRADALELTTSGLRGVRLPAIPFSEPGATGNAAGLATVSWVDDGRVLVADRTPDGFGAPITVAVGEVDRTRVIRGRGGATLVLWRQETDLMVAARPAGGSFGPGPPRLGEHDGRRAGRAHPHRRGARGRADRGQLAGRGAPARATRRRRRSARAGPVTRPRAARGARRRRHRERVRRLDGRELRARGHRATHRGGGILGPARLLAARTDPSSIPTLAATGEGGAVLAWVAGGDAHARTYRP